LFYDAILYLLSSILDDSCTDDTDGCFFFSVYHNEQALAIHPAFFVLRVLGIGARTTSNFIDIETD
jgi:hypothetical protein